MRKFLSYALVAVIAAFVAIQFAPVDKSNPRISREVHWDSPDTEALARRACYDCHSNETTWPWYASVAPVSWRVSAHVADGRRHLNFSAWDQPNENLDEIVEQVEKGEMPLSDYLLLHWDAKLSPDESARLLDGIRATFAEDPPIERRRREPAGVPDSIATPDAVTDSLDVSMPADSVRIEGADSTDMGAVVDSLALGSSSADSLRPDSKQ
jgi:hypothetical protein